MEVFTPTMTTVELRMKQARAAYVRYVEAAKYKQAMNDRLDDLRRACREAEQTFKRAQDETVRAHGAYTKAKREISEAALKQIEGEV